MLKITIDDKSVMRQLTALDKQMPYAQSLLVNELGKGVMQNTKEMMPSVIDRPTRFTLNSMYLGKATKQTPTATVGFKDIPKRSSNYLEPIIKGGPRHKKGTEIVLGNRWLTPGKAAQPLGYIDGHGNFKASMLQQLRSYFGKAELTAGYTANSKKPNRDKLAKMKRTLNGKVVTKKQLLKDPKRGYKTIGGKVFFMSMGKGSGPLGKQHLAAGIWQKSGIHGVNVQPVLMQSKQPQYRKQFDFYGNAQQCVTANYKQICSKVIDEVLRSAR